MAEQTASEQVASRRWALEQAVRYLEKTDDVDSGQVIRIADKFRRFVDDGTVPR